MKHKFLVKNGNSRLILIFAGWSSYPDLYADCKMQGWDLLVVYDYTTLDFDLDIISSYSTINLYAWSLGVAAAEYVIPDRLLSHAFAVNGTSLPVDDQFGIPKYIFKATADTLSPKNLYKFRRRMLESSSDMALFDYPDRDNIEELKEQLYSFLKHDFSTSNRISWTRAYVGQSDRIFPHSTQEAAWKSHISAPSVVVDNSQHFIPLSRIVHSTIHDKSRVASRFRRALATYDDNASAQTRIASHLTASIKKYFDTYTDIIDVNSLNVLEIGPGTGIFSRMYANAVNPRHISYIDLYQLPQFNLAESENYIVDDAEQYIENSVARNNSSDIVSNSLNCINAIFSASTIQWFANPQRFFENASHILSPNGLLAVSSFLPGNLSELDSIRPSSMFYPDIDTLKKYVEKYFHDVKIEEETVVLEFKSAKEVLRHLSLTGVGGGSIMSSTSVSELLSSLHPDKSTPSTLTYRVVYIIGMAN